MSAAAKGDETPSLVPSNNNTDMPPIIGSGPTVLLEDIPVDDIYKQAIQRTLAWVTGASLFGGILWFTAGAATGEEFFAGYLVEQSLSVDNLFVFLLLFDYFQVPLQNQDRVLNYGIYGAIIMRGVMIALGAAALENFHAILLVFAGILVYSSARVLIGGDENEDEEQDMSDNFIVKISHRFIESTDTYDGNRFFTVVDGIRKATPLFICMIAVEISDVVFAVDSIPAVFGVTEVSLFVFTYTCRVSSLDSLFAYFTCLESAYCLYFQHVCHYGIEKSVHHSIQSSHRLEILGTCCSHRPWVYWCQNDSRVFWHYNSNRGSPRSCINVLRDGGWTVGTRTGTNARKRGRGTEPVDAA